jgi:hypothetical protein
MKTDGVDRERARSERSTPEWDNKASPFCAAGTALGDPSPRLAIAKNFTIRSVADTSTPPRAQYGAPLSPWKQRDATGDFAR